MAQEQEIMDTGAPPADAPRESLPDDHYDQPADITPDAPTPAEKPAAEIEKKSALDALNEALDGKKEPADEAQKPDEPEKAEKKPEQAPDAKPNELYQIPKGATGEYRAKYKALADHAVAQDAKIAEYEQRVEQVQKRYEPLDHVIRDSQAQPEQMALAFQFIAAINAGKWEDALAIMDGERKELARLAGKSLEGADLLDDFEDLRNAVDGMELTREHAEEIAKARLGQKRQEQAQGVMQQRAAQEQQVQQYQAAVQTARAEVSAWEAQLKGVDIDAPRKIAAVHKYLVSDAGKATLQSLPPNLWKQHLQAVYDSIPAAAPRAPSKGPQPLRPSGGGTGVVPASGKMSSQEAMERALGYAQG